MKQLFAGIALLFMSQFSNAQELPITEKFSQGPPRDWTIIGGSIDNFFETGEDARCITNKGIVTTAGVGSNGKNEVGFVTAPIQYISNRSIVTVLFDLTAFEARMKCGDQLRTLPCASVAKLYLVHPSFTGSGKPTAAQIYGESTLQNVTTNNRTVLNVPVNPLLNLPNNTEFRIFLDISNDDCSGQGGFRYALDNIFITAREQSILPVAMKFFTASRSSHKVTLAWETTYEDNNKGFQLQRNIDGEWKNIAFVFSKAERGTSTAALSYSYADNNSHKGISQYRLLQVDIDGKGKYSEIRSVRGEESGSKLSIFPNPSNDGKVNILFEEGTTAKDVIVSDITGRVIKQYKNIKNNNLVVDGLTDGYYTIQVLNNTTATTTVEKVIVKKR